MNFVIKITTNAPVILVNTARAMTTRTISRALVTTTTVALYATVRNKTMLGLLFSVVSLSCMFYR